jgi:hypothetical protein
MTVYAKRLLLVPILAVLYVVHPVLGFVGLASGFVALFFVRRARGPLSHAQVG